MHQHLPPPKRKILPAIIGFIFIFFYIVTGFNFNSQNFQVTQVINADEEATQSNTFFDIKQQNLTVLNPNNQQTEEITYSVAGTESQITKLLLKPEQSIITYQETELAPLNVVDRYRIPGLIGLFIFFVAVTILITGKETIYSFLSLFLTIVVVLLIIKSILNGTSPLISTIIGCIFIGTISIYVAHGFNEKTHLSTISIIATLFLTLLNAIVFTEISSLTGSGSESSFYLGNNPNLSLDLRSLLLAGIMIGTLGVLDDITTTQVATIHELHHTNPKLTFKQLYTKGINVGKTHISSLINTLVLAYTGGSLPMIVLLYTDPSIPIWVTINQEFFAEEIIRTIVGSISLVLAVPISTALSAKFYSSKKQTTPQINHKH